MTTEFLIQIDSKPYTQKPTGKEMAAIKARTQGSEPKRQTATQLLEVIKQGYTVSPAILKGGLSAEHWTQQQLFFVDIDNENENSPTVVIQDTLEICTSKGIAPLLYYETYSHTTKKPKFRLVFAINEPVFNKAKRKLIIETLISFFPQADTSCANADRVFLGTNKRGFLT